MRRLPTLALFLPVLLLLAACASAPAPTLLPAPTPTATPSESALPGWELVWQDEFAGESLDRSKWGFDLGGGGWGNNELQFYTDRPENVRVTGGQLIIEARAEEWRGWDYTSARLKTQALHAWTYGRIEARMKLPTGRGIWSAFWMLGEDIATAGWPRSGEIDIMENIGAPHTIYGTLHGPGYSGGDGVGAAYTRMDIDFAAEFHTFAVEWRPEEIRWFVDDALFFQINAGDTPGPWVYDHPFFILLNLAVGGNWPGSPDASTSFPQQFVIDYVRVYRDPTLTPAALQKPTIHAAAIDLETAGAGADRQVTVFVTVVDETGAGVAGAEVEAGWLGVIAGATSGARTDVAGRAGPFLAQPARGAKEITFCIYDIRKAGSLYDKQRNSATCVFQPNE